MNKKNFDLLLESMREGGEILRGERKPSRRFVVENKEDVQQVRQTFNLSQDTFAKFMGVSVGTLRNWEQGRRHPSGAARVLLRIAIRQPKLFADVVSEDYPEMIRSRRFGGGAASGVSLLLYLFCAFMTYFAGGGML